jgi:hypothetical protein
MLTRSKTQTIIFPRLRGFPTKHRLVITKYMEKLNNNEEKKALLMEIGLNQREYDIKLVESKVKRMGQEMTNGKAIPRNTKLATYMGVLEQHRPNQRAEGPQLEKTMYVIGPIGKVQVDNTSLSISVNGYGMPEVDGQINAAMVNHSCTPNCEAVKYKIQGIPIPIPVLVTCRKIKAGEALTFDYNGDMKKGCYLYEDKDTRRLLRDKKLRQFVCRCRCNGRRRCPKNRSMLIKRDTRK